MTMHMQKWTPWNWLKAEHKGVAKHSALADRIQGRNYSSPADLTNATIMEGHPLHDLHRDIDRLFGDAFSGYNIFPSFAHTPMFSEPVLKPNIDIAETEKSYAISVEIPGVEEKDVTLELSDDGMLTIKGEKKAETAEGDKNYQFIERSYGSFQRVLALPEDALAESIKADFKNGILQITLQRDAVAKPEGTKVINIKSAA